MEEGDQRGVVGVDEREGGYEGGYEGGSVGGGGKSEQGGK